MRRPCCEDQHVNKGAWSKQEDEKLINYIYSHGEGCWRSLPKAAGLLRCGKSCRLRWINYLRPDLKRGKFAEDEEDLIIKLHALLGNRWSLIAGRLPGRTDNEVKNYWNSHLRKRVTEMGVDQRNRWLTDIKSPSHSNRWPYSPGVKLSPSPMSLHRCNSCTPSSYQPHAGDVWLSDEASSVEDDSTMLPDLNLDLNRSSTFPFHSVASQTLREMKEAGDGPPPTLLQFI
ncbi:unnamed protein product [Spirodela intermedia]|uniref:Uncharacterized protein n=1 Tax=Spirodela intermedia TaxID=51605 RepID=A0A7I8KYT6_SPIIN|nr:unnamed protein product [Spirodela intermedia]